MRRSTVYALVGALVGGLIGWNIGRGDVGAAVNVAAAAGLVVLVLWSEARRRARRRSWWHEPQMVGRYAPASAEEFMASLDAEEDREGR